MDRKSTTIYLVVILSIILTLFYAKHIIYDSIYAKDYGMGGISFRGYPEWNLTPGDSQKGQVLMAEKAVYNDSNDVIYKLNVVITKRTSSENLKNVRDSWIDKAKSQLKSQGYKDMVVPGVEEITVDDSIAYLIRFFPKESLNDQFVVLIIKKNDTIYEIFFTGRYGDYAKSSRLSGSFEEKNDDVILFLNTLKIGA